MKNGCSRINCPVQYDKLQECILESNECKYFTPEIDYKMLYENICNHIADLVVEKLKNNKEIEINSILTDIKSRIQDLDLGYIDEDYRAGFACCISKVTQIINEYPKTNNS